MAGQKFNVSVNPNSEAVFYVDYSLMDVYVNKNNPNDVKTNNDPVIEQQADIYQFDETLTQARFDSFKKQFITKMQDKFKSLKSYDETVKGKHILLTNDSFLIAFEDNDWSVAIELLETPKPKDPDIRPNLFPTFKQGIRDVLLELVDTIHLRTGSYSTRTMTKADAVAEDAAEAAAKAAEQKEKDAIATNGIPDVDDDTQTTNATADNTVKDTAESATEPTAKNSTATEPASDSKLDNDVSTTDAEPKSDTE